jgi:hypothetical protein
MVQMVFDGIGRGNAQWNLAENYLRNNFCNTGGYTVAIRDYYNGLFSFTKSMLLTPGGGIKFLANQPGNTNPIDWYGAEASAGAQCDGVARKLVNDQLADGHWPVFGASGYHNGFVTPWAIIMLNRTVFESGVPVAVAKATPSFAVGGQTITLDGRESFHQDSAKSIDSWQWDFNNDGIWDATGPVVTTSFPVLGSYPVTLRVTDNASPEKDATTTVVVKVALPPLAPTANAGGPYNFCPNTAKWYLDGTGSVNPDQGLSEPGRPGDTIQSYAWDFGNGLFNGASGAQPEVKAAFTALGAGSHLVQLRVTDTTATSFPSSNLGNLSSVAGTTVNVKASTDPACSCVANLAARPKSGKIQLTWTAQAGVAGYNVYRGAVNGGPYLKIGSTASTYATFLDSTVVNNTPYYYVIRTTSVSAVEGCQSNQATATATAVAR